MQDPGKWIVGSPPGAIGSLAGDPVNDNGRRHMARPRAGPTGTNRDAFKTSLWAEVPRLRAFAISLSGHFDRADDLVQETLTKAWANADSFTEGTNLSAWLFTILRNAFITDIRKRRREVPDSDGGYAATLRTLPNQHGHMDLLDLRSALKTLNLEHREALLLVGASGMSYEEAAHICGCAVGTVKSRVHRARSRLAQLLSKSTSGRIRASA